MVIKHPRSSIDKNEYAPATPTERQRQGGELLLRQLWRDDRWRRHPPLLLIPPPHPHDVASTFSGPVPHTRLASGFPFRVGTAGPGSGQSRPRLLLLLNNVNRFTFILWYGGGPKPKRAEKPASEARPSHLVMRSGAPGRTLTITPPAVCAENPTPKKGPREGALKVSRDLAA